jgi:hypothetical protein
MTTFDQIEEDDNLVSRGCFKNFTNRQKAGISYALFLVTVNILFLSFEFFEIFENPDDG